jgi:Arm DNA-binding domain
VTDKGVRTFIDMRRLSGQKNPVRFALGAYPDMKLAQARNRADEVRQELKAGVHPREKRRWSAASRPAATRTHLLPSPKSSYNSMLKNCVPSVISRSS